MNRILDILLGIGILLFVVIRISDIMHWLDYNKVFYTFGSAFVIITLSLKYFLSSKVTTKNNLVLLITVTYLTFSTLAKYDLPGLSVFPILFLAGSLFLLIIELLDWINGKPKQQKMNWSQILCLVSFLIMAIFKIKHYAGASIPMIVFLFSLIGLSIDMLKKKGI